jgi:hypothetical protein
LPEIGEAVGPSRFVDVKPRHPGPWAWRYFEKQNQRLFFYSTLIFGRPVLDDASMGDDPLMSIQDAASRSRALPDCSVIGQCSRRASPRSSLDQPAITVQSGDDLDLFSCDIVGDATVSLSSTDAHETG